MAAGTVSADQVIQAFRRRHRLRLYEALPWLVAIAGFFVFPSYQALGAQILATVVFALSLDLAMGYAGIVTLGHSAFFGVGAYTAGILGANGWTEPITGLIAAGVVAAIVGLISGAVVLRTRGLSLLMLTLVVATMLQEAANKANSVTGGSDGLQGMEVAPVLGLFKFDLYYHTAYFYSLVVLFLLWYLARRIVHSPFGHTLQGIRENEARMNAIGSPVYLRRLTVYSIAAGFAGVSGALVAQMTKSVALNVLSFDTSGEIIIMLMLGGVGRLYGAFLGVPIFMIAKDRFSEVEPVYWYFWIGLLLVLIVVFVPGGALGLIERLRRRKS
jgi:branched-chain amino acid transport system permease protein